jgi:class 3 adenylate cyclase
MGKTRKLAAILVADGVGCSRLAGADEDLDRPVEDPPLGYIPGKILGD